MRRLLPLACAAALAACAVAKPVSTQPAGPGLDALEALESLPPAKAAAKLEAALRPARRDTLPFEVRQVQGQAGLIDIERGYGTRHELRVGLPTVFDERVRRNGRALLALSRAREKLGDRARARRAAEDALSLSARALSPLTAAELSRDAGRLLAALHESAGRKGAAALARLDAGLAEDYLTSPAAAADRKAWAELAAADEERVKGINAVVHNANERQSRRLADAFSQAAGQYAATVGFVGAGTGDARLMSAANMAGRVKSLADARLKGGSAFGVAALDFALGELRLRQLSDADAGPKAGSEYRLFLDAARQGAPGTPLAALADKASPLLDAALAARGSGAALDKAAAFLAALAPVEEGAAALR